jgi:hypothetical protein
VAQAIVEAQLACFDAGTCPEPVPMAELRQAVPTEAIVTQAETPVPLIPPSADAAAQATIAAQATRIAALEEPTSTPDAAQATIAAQETRVAQLEGTLTPPTITPTPTPIPPTATPLPTSTPDPAQATITAQAARIATLEVETRVTPTVLPEPEAATATPPPTDRLGRVWEVREIGGGWTGVWTRRGTSELFDAVWTSVAGTELTGVLTITIAGDQVAVQRPQFGANGACDYVGTLAADGRTAHGTFSCTEDPGPFDWEATITGLAPESATPAASAGLTPTESALAGDFMTPDPAACTVTPRTAEEITGLAASPDQAATDTLATASLDPSLSIPEGAPADAATIEAVTETYQQMIACFNAGNDLAAFAFWSDEALRQIQVDPPAAAVPTPLPEGERSAVRVTEVRMLPDGQVVAVWEERSPAFTTTLVQRLVRQDERYVIAETVDALFAALSDEALVPQPATPEPTSTPLPPPPTAQPASPTALPDSTALPEGFVGHWAGTATWETAPLPVTMDLTAGSLGEVVGTIAYALYGSDGPTCGGEVSLQQVAPDGQQIELAGTITEDPSVCLVDATITVSLQADGTFSYDWRHPFFVVTGSGTLQPTSPTTGDHSLAPELADLLPNVDNLPLGFVITDEAERSKDDVAAGLGGTEEAAALLDDWGWSGNAVRDFTADEDAPPPSGTTLLTVSVHRFADPEAAANAVIYFSDHVIDVLAFEDAAAPAISERARLLEGAPDGVPVSLRYVHQGPILSRSGGSTSTADGTPRGDVLAVADAIISGERTVAEDGALAQER